MCHTYINSGKLETTYMKASTKKTVCAARLMDT